MSTVAIPERVDSPLTFCTIISKNYLPSARALHESIQTTNPGCRFFALLVDRPDGYFDPSAEPFTIIPLEALPIPELPRFCFQYNILELNTAAKPFFMQFLMEHYGVRKLIYFDPDILVLNDLTHFSSLLDEHSILLTPHITSARPEDRCIKQEINILWAGTYNLGFLAVSGDATTMDFLKWWSDRLLTWCTINIPGLFVDQKWIGLVPGMFEGVHILTSPGYNIAYWNIASRRITFQGQHPLANGQPAYFFHFSGFNPLKPQNISKWKTGVTVDQVGEARGLYLGYAQKLIEHGHNECVGWPYAYGRFDNGEPITDLVRQVYWELGDRVRRFGNPFCTEPPHSYFRWLAAPPQSPLRRGVPAAILVPLWCALPTAARKIGRRLYHGIRRRLLGSGAGPSDPEASHEAAQHGRAAPFRAHLAKSGHKSNGKRRLAIRTGVPRISTATPISRRPFGVNVAGYFQSEKGTGEASRAVLRALRAAHLPFVLNNVTDTSAANVHCSAGDFARSNPYAFNLVLVNADQALPFAAQHPNYLRGRINVGYWNWELAEFPSQWRSSFDLFDEIWVPSNYTQQAVAAASPIPVRYVPFAVTVPDQPPLGVGRGHFRLPPNAFLFLFAFDYASYFERKNPMAVVEAFHRAFGSRRDVHLMLKTTHGESYRADHDRLAALCEGKRNITVLNEVITRPEMLGLIALCDCYVSLHRCEGFGLTLAEAMALGKPVIATQYSANTDFMDATNSCPVRHRLVELAVDHGPYRRGQVWADPDIEHAIEWMQRLVEDRAESRRIGEKARHDIRTCLSPRRIGDLISSYLAELGNRKQDSTPAAKTHYFPFLAPQWKRAA